MRLPDPVPSRRATGARPRDRSLLYRWVARAGASAALAGLTILPGHAAVDTAKYHTHAELTTELQTIAKAHASMVKLVEIGRTRQNRSLWAVEVAAPGGAPVETRPGVLVVAGLEGDGLTGSALALQAIDGLVGGYATNPDVKRQLDSSVFYVIPRLNADALEGYFEAVKTGRRTNTMPFDADNDGRVDEDGPEDLNKDGLITVMRVKDPLGPYTTHADDPRLLKRADPQKGEAGGWAVYWEGIDNDGDGFYNEDGPGGADLDRNFPHQYAYYQPDAGRHMVSEAETRAFFDYVIKRRNIAAILTFGASDNLVTPPTAAGGGRAATLDLAAFADQTAAARAAGIVRDQPPQGFFGGGGAIEGSEFAPPPAPPAPQRPPAPRPATTVNAADVEVFRHAGEKYKELTGIRQLALARRPAGALFEWGYFQFGVPSFSTPGWGSSAAGTPPAGAAPTAAAGPGAAATRPADVPAAMPAVPGGGRAGAAAGAGQGGPGGPGGPGGRRAAGPAAPGAGAAGAESGAAADDVALLKWLEGEKVDAFVAWTPFTHPTLGAVELGGFRPYATSAPVARLSDLAKSHSAFLIQMSQWLPRVGIAKSEVTSHGGGLFRIKVEIENRGQWPTALQHAVVARAVKPVMVQLGVEPSAIVSGNPKTNFLPTLAGGGRRQAYEWIVRGKTGDTVTVKVVAEKGGTATASLTLK